MRGAQLPLLEQTARVDWYSERGREEMLRRMAAASALAQRIHVTGGACDVSEERATRFDVTMDDGRVFVGCGVHGSGGLIRFPKSPESALGMATGNLLRTSGVGYLCLVSRFFGNESIAVQCCHVVAVELHGEVSK